MRQKLLLLVFVAALPRLAAGQSTGAISGTVLLQGTDAPIAGLTVAAHKDLGDLATATTNAAGVYTITGVEPGNYYVHTRAAATSPLKDAVFNHLCTACGDSPHTVTVAAGATVSGVDFKLSDFTGAISGTLTFAPLPFAGPVTIPEVQVYDRAGQLVRSATPVAGPGASAGSITSQTPAGGTFTWTVAGLAADTYYVRTFNRTLLQSSVGAQIGSPSGGWLVDEAYDNIVCVAADCSPLRGKPIAVFAAAGGASPTTGIDITLDYGATIRGGTSNRGGQIEIYDSRGVRLPDRVSVDPDTLFNSYLANGLPAGTYYLRMQHGLGRLSPVPASVYKDIPCAGCAVTTGTPVPVTLGESRVGVDFTELPSRAIQGTVRSNGAGLLGITVGVFAANGQLAGKNVFMASGGAYTISGLNPGTYYARTTNTSGYADAVYGGPPCSGCDPLGGTPIVVAAGADTTGIDFDLVPGGTIAGLLDVFFAVGVPVGPVQYPVPNVGVTIYTPSNAIAARTAADAFGIFSATVPPGTYYVQTEAANGYATKRFGEAFCPQGVCAPGSGTAVTVVAGSTTTADIRMEPACAAVSLSPVSLAAAAVGSPYRQGLVASGGFSAKRFAISAGSLPPGLSLDPSTGVLSGTPTASGHFTFTVSVQHEFGCATIRSYTLDVPACPFTLANYASLSRAWGEPFFIQVSNTCGSWTASTAYSWIKLQPSGQNPTTVVGAPLPYSGTTPRVGYVTIGPRVYKVTQNGVVTAPPFGSLDTPANGAVVSGSISVSGWALDDMIVSRVEIFRDPIAGEPAGQIFLGNATFVPGARPDVQAAFPSTPENGRAGWGYLLLTNMLPNQGNGTFNIYAYAIDSDLTRQLVGARTIVATNNTATTPFGAIDTPGQGATAAGTAYVNWGWALTPQPKLIPFDGSTISIVIDGVAVGPLTEYHLFRTDIASLFPGLKNSGGAVGYRRIDTTALSEGIHTIAWLATDDGGQTTGIGSRYFTVQNSAWVPSLTSAVSRAPALRVPPRIDGLDIGRRSASLATLPLDADGARAIELRQLRRLEIALSTADAVCAPTYEGYLSANGELRALPIGSSLDPKGTFYWQPGPGFLGSYQLLFVRTTCDGARERIPVTVRIR